MNSCKASRSIDRPSVLLFHLYQLRHHHHRRHHHHHHHHRGRRRRCQSDSDNLICKRQVSHPEKQLYTEPTNQMTTLLSSSLSLRCLVFH
ncbi:unnamed protein product [Ceratitis capitata]|uniref:(Mediterranean fruit fly) hypothetical protein n=1 Tax=Ceratitis capitata TaxID=7213 RepID=A0A811U915_CERCA|nr:unnamed protein product [Ceratitis capitata]